MTRLFLIEEYKRNFTFLVEISAIILITRQLTFLWNDEQKHTNKDIKFLHNSGKRHIKISNYFLLNFICLSFNNTTSGH